MPYWERDCAVSWIEGKLLSLLLLRRLTKALKKLKSCESIGQGREESSMYGDI